MYVTDFKAANQRIDAVCRGISEMVLLLVERKATYQHSQFQELQAAHHTQVGGWGVLVCAGMRVCVGVHAGVLLLVERKATYQHSQFQELQAAHHAQVGGWGWGWGCECVRKYTCGGAAAGRAQGHEPAFA